MVEAGSLMLKIIHCELYIYIYIYNILYKFGNTLRFTGKSLHDSDLYLISV